MNVVCRDQEIHIEELNGTVYIHRASTTKDFRGQAVQHPVELLFSISPEEASLLASTIRIVLGQEQVLEPKEKVQTP